MAGLTPLEAGRPKAAVAAPSAGRLLTGLTPREGVGYPYCNLLALLQIAFPSPKVSNLTCAIRRARDGRGKPS
ncbi:hypothetical protein COU12_01520 [Candidatus Jorgensenbacteria bacterium CG10_big_fil_rev_8_21_14_0_10_54_38]|uniref:Uncharacterized protein n=2 Tax=Candidatus Joergenseniibacteriota TaxID=1752739 RepID=A0A2M6WG04_9BACT|nr:MAG: hypothetical protein COX26_01905 [Candidatus Jorgensenbacteria bacterium CG23_combo_of_CG06-09_8_20_14_all_54_14]PIT91730.1 MAG: hypothetical protein COU12_01520 [Candidatus Jorgensenbacteria bacterium CG10_big_fil_rev_8_21_14_0_10_54_38]